MNAAERHGCAFCVALQRLAIRRRDLALIEAAERVAEEHAANDAEREALTLAVLTAWRRAGRRRLRP